MRAAAEGELRLLDPQVRASPDAVTGLLDREFTEFGASGRRYDRASVLVVTSAGGEEAPARSPPPACPARCWPPASST